jgi:hypothetical protein
MFSNKSLIELHYFSGGLQTKVIGSTTRPEWLPDYDLVGLHNDVYPKSDEYVIEVSRHKRQDKYITWIGVYTSGKDLVYGDRSNYIGVGVWLINTIPSELVLIIDALYQICKKISEDGNIEGSHCQDLLDNYLHKWIDDINILPNQTDGIPFDVSLHPETIYFRCNNNNIDASLINVSNSISMNCISIDEIIAGKSRILYLLLNPNSEFKTDTTILTLVDDINPIKLLTKYFSKSFYSLNKENSDLKEKIQSFSKEKSDLIDKYNASQDLANNYNANYNKILEVYKKLKDEADLKKAFGGNTNRSSETIERSRFNSACAVDKYTLVDIKDNTNNIKDKLDKIDRSNSDKIFYKKIDNIVDSFDKFSLISISFNIVSLILLSSILISIWFK